LPPFNPGGPNVEITLKNVSTEPIISLTAVFTSLGPHDIDINFDVGSVNPLSPGASISDTQPFYSLSQTFVLQWSSILIIVVSISKPLSAALPPLSNLYAFVNRP
jgi:hypothetical protein